MHKLVLATALLAPACSGQRSSHLYAGQLEPVSGVCEPASQAQLVIHGQVVVFAPNSGTLVLTGRKEGSMLTATQSLAGVDRQPYILRFTGNLHGLEVGGVYSTARCRYRVQLHSVSP